MDNRTQFAKLKKLAEEYNGKEVNLEELHSLLIMNVASSLSIVRNAVRVMAMGGLLIDLGNARFRIKKHEM